MIPFDSIFILNLCFFNVCILHLDVFVPYLVFVELTFSSLFSTFVVCYLLLLHQRSYFLYLDAWLHFNWMSEHCYNIVGSRFCCITLTNTRCILTYSSVALESLQFFCVFCTMSNRNSETDVGAQPEDKKSETSSYWLLPLS